ncbi:MAG: hypothetical protein HW384_356 [Dehalococcoidia bacterium]|nr:hypothetical protein [Dehalococcoidia bacterium]
MANLPLEGFKILDFSQVAFGPVCTRLLGDLGADVIKVEPLEGEFSRLTSKRKGESMSFLTSNRSKRDICLNLNDPRGKDIALEIAGKVDVIVQNFRPGVMARLGLDYVAVRKINPRVIYASFSMYGETGPLAHRRGGDPWAQGFTGMVASQGSPEGPPYLAGHLVVDYTGAALNAFGIVTALLMRERTGLGQEITNNLTNSGVYIQDTAICTYLNDGVLLKKGGRGNAQGMFPYGTYPAKDGDVVTIFGQDDDEWVTFCQILGIEYLLADSRYDTAQKRVERKFEIYPILDEAFRKKTRAEWAKLFSEHKLRCDPCLDYAELVQHPQFKENDLVVELDHPNEGRLKMLGMPINFMGIGPIKPNRPPPLLGEHTRQILLEMGHDPEEIAILHEEGVIGFPDTDK